eukprot:CAMPEP_0198419158 /NCGR_PEP_ID=MMETSP1452-20131203/14_1 /TAXON_ID=1181717 /ORGANISM="Synchroma pusillum, Strain CCMP3072" /LENGTH=561 /DNA_ID=CAMNT_0044139281 /DNA_START=57 /DNA_END=1742 /DNA_ORIENTATION=-
MFRLLALAGLAAASAAVLKETQVTGPRAYWSKRSPCGGEQEHEVVIAVQQRNMDQLEAKLLEISDPTNPSYGMWLTYDEVTAMTANLPGTDAVLAYVNSFDRTEITRITRRGDYITVKAPLAVFEVMFQTEFHNYVDGNGQSVCRAEAMHVPEELNEHILGSFHLVDLPFRAHSRPKPMLKSDKRLGRGATVTPAVLNSYYNIASNAGNDRGSQSLFESLDQNFSPSDLSDFERANGIPQDAVDNVIGGHNSDSACQSDANNCAEANLDVQYIMAIAQNVETTYWYVDNSLRLFTTWIQDVADTRNPPLVHSISYGGGESDIGKSTYDTFNNEAMKLGAQGVTITVSSGDDGAAGSAARSSPSNCGYGPSWPATSPYVVAVGATQGAESGKTESVCMSDTGGVITSGGGFSSQFKALSYQNAAVSAYFDELSRSEQPASGYDASNRAYPDVSMAGYNYEVTIAGKTYLLSGTSASSPVFAGLVSLVNSARLAKGKSALGYINQAIYQYGSQFTNDVTSGNNLCTASKTCCSEGFYAAAGWDPTTGFGSVDFAKFSSIMTNL